MPRRVPFSESDARAAVAAARCWADALRLLGYEPKGSNFRTLRHWVERWDISTEHFDPNLGRVRAGITRRMPLSQLLVEHSTYPRGHLKRRLLQSGLKTAVCELCGQDESWMGKRMALVLDHVNGIANDHRLENLRMVCPNCAATLETHCGRNLPKERVCPGCKQPFVPTKLQHRYCSQACWGVIAAGSYRGVPHPETRKVPRPSQEQLNSDLASMSFLAVGRKYGVSDNAVRKWLRWYSHQAEREEGGTGLPEPQPA